MVLQNTGDRITPISIGNSIQLQYFGRSKSKVTAKRAAVILIPVLRKAPDVACYVKTNPDNPKDVKTILLNPTYRKLILSLSFYLFAILALFYFRKTSPSGPCTPGLDMISFLLLILTIPILTIINVIKTYRGDKSNKPSTIVHAIALLTMIIYLTANN